MKTEIQRETARRRTFAIISHPDAGKTTLTEKFLLYGGAKDLAGGVRDRKNATSTSSDWLELEKQRGISVSSTVLQFDYSGYRINLLDTPGHRDFSEDTYRVLTAVDSALMVIDAAKGIEEQTLKLFEVCKSRNIPIIIFINKCDRPSKEPLELLDEIEASLGLKPYCANLPIGNGSSFIGSFDRENNALHLFQKLKGGRFRAPVETMDFDDVAMKEHVPADLLEELAETSELLEAIGTQPDPELIANGQVAPVYFGSAINNFGVQLLLDGFLKHANPPQPREAKDSFVETSNPAFSAFVFKIQANMDPKHRDRLAFLRICSGRFHRDLRVKHAQTGKQVRLAYSHQMFGRERETQEEAWPGDILGLTGQPGLEIGDTLTEDTSIVYNVMSRFAPECFVYLHHTDTQTHKRFRTGLQQLLQEKVIQQFFLPGTGNRIALLGAVGALQFDVVRYRLLSEYGADSRVESAPWTQTRWIDAEAVNLPALSGRILGGGVLAQDDLERPCLLFESDWSLNYFCREHPEVNVYKTPPRPSMVSS